MAHIFAWHDTAVTNPTTEKRKTKIREMFTSLWRRRMAGVKIVDGEIAGGEDVIPATALGDENAGVS